MEYIEGTVNSAYPTAISKIFRYGQTVDIMRNGALSASTRELHPAVLEIQAPRERLVTSFGRPVNVAFALAEVLWILAGRDDVEMLSWYNSRIADYSDDGVKFNAPYGRRLRFSFGHDQIEDIVATLREDSSSRQAVVAVWNPVDDRGHLREPTATGGLTLIPKVTKDRACNIAGMALIRNGHLDWTQVMRSNDIIWGLPYNLMQWTHVQEWVATLVGVPVGDYTHFANSLHLYEAHNDEASSIKPFDLYTLTGSIHPKMKAGLEVLNALLREELILRTSAAEWELPLDQHDLLGAYWVQVLSVLAAHRAYRAGKNMEAFRLLTDAGPIYSLAQMRFYMHNRWWKPEHATVREYVDDYIAMNCRQAASIQRWMNERVVG